jgi:hypothetical protein
MMSSGAEGRWRGEVRDPEPKGLSVPATDPIPTDEVWYG